MNPLFIFKSISFVEITNQFPLWKLQFIMGEVVGLGGTIDGLAFNEQNDIY